MKRFFFVIVLFLTVCFSSLHVVNAEEFVSDYGGRYSFTYTADVGYTSTTYYFEFIAYNKPVNGKIIIRYYDSNDNLNYITPLESKSWITDDSGKFIEAAYDGKAVLVNSTDIKSIVACFDVEGDDLSLVDCVLTGTLTDIVEPDPTPTNTPKPTPTNTPKPTNTPTPTCTPEPDPSSTPTPKPTNTPKPTPTNSPTPTPSPTPAPILELNAFATSKDAVAHYRTGGCTPVRSLIEFYEVDTSANILSKINSEQFLSGSGTMRNNMIPGKVYRYKLTYIYQQDGVQYEKFLWSDYLSIVDQELEDYRNNKRITNFRTLMLYVWEDVMALNLPIEGYNISFQTLFIWLMVAFAIIAFLKWYKG